MIDSYLKLNGSEIKTLLSFKTKNKNIIEQKELILNVIEYEKLKELQQIPKDLFICTQILQGDNVTISKIIPAIRTVKYNLQSMKLKRLVEVATNITDSFNRRFMYLEDEIFYFATILDPNFAFDFLAKAERDLWITKLKDILEVDYDNNTLISSLSKRKSPPKYWTRLPGCESNDENDSDLILNEINIYLEKSRCYIKKHYEDIELAAKMNRSEPFYKYADAFLFLKDNESSIKYLPDKAKQILSIPATSASVERFFSKTGFILRPHRRRIDDDLAEKLFFLKAIARFKINIIY